MSRISLAASPNVRVVATTQEPGITSIDGVGISLNADGWTAFRTGSNRIYSEAGGVRQIVAQTGLAATGTGAYFGTDFSAPIINKDGTLVFHAALEGGDAGIANNRGMWIGQAGTLSLVARTGNQAIGLADGVKFLSFPTGQSIAFNAEGKVAFSAKVVGSDIDVNRNDGIWSASPGSLRLVAMENRPAPSGIGTYIGIGDPIINNVGTIAFKSTIAPPVGAPFVGIFQESLGDVNLVLKSGDPAPGAGVGIVFDTPSFSEPDLNDRGDIVFRTNTTHATFAAKDEGIWVKRNGTIQKVAMSGDAAPGTANQFLYPFGAPVINGQGRTAFTANLTGPTNPLGAGNYSVWSEGRNGDLELVARQGQQAPDLPAGFVFGEDFKNPSINSSGHIAFMAQIANLIGTYGLWAQDENFDLKLIALVGNPIADSGLPGTINSSTLVFLSGSGNQDGRRSAFNNLGQVAFRAGLSSGIQAGIVSNLAAVPEPAALAVVGLASLISLLRRADRTAQ